MSPGSFSKIKSFKGFKTLDLAVTMSLVLFAAVLIFSLALSNTEDPLKSKAERGAKGLALQLASGGLEDFHSSLEQNSLDRGPASIGGAVEPPNTMELFGRRGQIGKDPWGNAYRYKFLEQNEDGGPQFILVWSEGENGQRDTPIDLIKVQGETNKEFVIFQGDDLGHVQKVTKH